MRRGSRGDVRNDRCRGEAVWGTEERSAGGGSRDPAVRVAILCALASVARRHPPAPARHSPGPRAEPRLVAAFDGAYALARGTRRARRASTFASPGPSSRVTRTGTSGSSEARGAGPRRGAVGEARARARRALGGARCVAFLRLRRPGVLAARRHAVRPAGRTGHRAPLPPTAGGRARRHLDRSAPAAPLAASLCTTPGTPCAAAARELHAGQRRRASTPARRTTRSSATSRTGPTTRRSGTTSASCPQTQLASVVAGAAGATRSSGTCNTGAWSLGAQGQGTVIAILDSGVNYYHQDLAEPDGQHEPTTRC